MEQKILQQGFSKKDIEENRIYAGLGYLIFFIPFLAKDSKFARFHANQILLLLIPSAIINILGGIISALLLGGLHFGMAGFVGLVITIIDLLIGAVAIFNMINAFQGKATRIPIVGRMTILQGSNDMDAEELIHNQKLNAMSEKLQNTSFVAAGNRGNVCPNCGEVIKDGKKFCSACGTRIEEKKVEERKTEGKKKCENCGAEVDMKCKFCPECGEEIVDKEPEMPETLVCAQCGAKLCQGMKFCPECGQAVIIAEEKKEKICTHCGAELAEGAKFCFECGNKVG